MITFYVDVYFLLNFLVDIIALLFMVGFVRLHVGFLRLVVISSVLSLYAVFTVLWDAGFITVALGGFLMLGVGVACAPRSAPMRKIKASLAFLIFQALIGGLVYFCYCLFEKLTLGGSLGAEGEVNRKLIIIALFVLLSICIMRIVFLIFANSRSETCIEARCEYFGRSEGFLSLVDSGNLVKDPLDGTPVCFVCRELFLKIFGISSSRLDDVDALPDEIRKRIRLIPVLEGKKTRLVIGVKISEFYICKNKREEVVPMIIAPSDEDSYGGYPALLPFCALEVV